MAETILKVQHATKRYGNHLALNDVSLTIERGAIYGLIGENGAGKSTLMRAVMGLIHLDDGNISLFGESTPAGLQLARRQMGQSIETPALYPELTAYANMQVQAANGGVGEADIQALLELMNLGSVGKKRVKNFSLGMRQRLTIAMTLVTNPQLLILDEPTNGLDPAGIVEIREIIKRLVSERGLTVLISSHLLDELAHVATHYAVLHNGRIVREMTEEELSSESQRYVAVTTPTPDEAIVVLDKLGWSSYEVVDGETVRVFGHIAERGLLNRELVRSGVEVLGLQVAGQSLEDIFLRLTEETDNE